MIPDPHWLLGHIPLMAGDDFRSVQHKYSVEYADDDGRVCFWMGPVPALSVSRAGDAQLVLKATAHRSLFPLMARHNDLFLGRNGIGVLTGKEWKANRAAVAKAFHAAAVWREHSRHMMRAVDVLVSSLRRRTNEADGTVANIPVDEVTKCLAFDIFGRAALGTDLGCCESLELSPVAAAFDFLTGDMMRRLEGVTDPTNFFYSLPTERNRRHRREREYLRSYVAGVVKDRRAAMDSGEDFPEDLLANLIRVRKENEEKTGDNGLSDETLMDTLLSLLFAGYETTSGTLTYSLYLISQHPEVEANALKEIENAWKGEDSRSGEFAYLNAVVMETLRLYPPAISTTRTLDKPIEFDGITVKEGTYMYIPIWTIQRDAKHFPEPEAFRPERWAEKNSHGFWDVRTNDNDVCSDSFPMGNRDAFLAFSSGARSCPGQKFANQEMMLALAMLLRAFEFRPCEDYVLTPHRDGFTQTPKDGMPMKLLARKQ